MVTASESGLQIELVSVEDIGGRWPLIVDRVAGCLRKAPSDFSPGDVWTQCRSGNWLLFLAWNGPEVIGYSIWQFTKNGYLACILLAGHDMATWWPGAVEIVTDICEAHGCRGLADTGRPGLIKAVRRSLPQTKIARVTYVSDF